MACPSCVKLLDAWTLATGGIIAICFLEFAVVQFIFKRQVSGRKSYTINDIKPNYVDSSFRIVIGLLLCFVIIFYLTFVYMSCHT